jgi:hypothetical protein
MFRPYHPATTDSCVSVVFSSSITNSKESKWLNDDFFYKHTDVFSSSALIKYQISSIIAFQYEHRYCKKKEILNNKLGLSRAKLRVSSASKLQLFKAVFAIWESHILLNLKFG